MGVWGWVGFAAYTVFAVGTVVEIFRQLPFIIALAWAIIAVVIALKWVGIIDWSWWWILPTPIVVALCYGRFIGFLMNRQP